LKTFERFDYEYLKLQYKQKLEELEEEKRSLQGKVWHYIHGKVRGLFPHHHNNLVQHSAANRICVSFML
jgi:hypothetical protein